MAKRRSRTLAKKGRIKTLAKKRRRLKRQAMWNKRTRRQKRLIRGGAAIVNAVPGAAIVNAAVPGSRRRRGAVGSTEEKVGSLGEVSQALTGENTPITLENYLNNLHIEIKDHSEQGDDSIQLLKEKLKKSIEKMEFNKEMIKNQIIYVCNKHANKGVKWVKCMGECDSSLRKIIQEELNSTAFLLRVLSCSIIDTTEEGNLPLVFIFNPDRLELLTGQWKDDYKFFKIKQLDPESNQSRLIMGLGPSASGKTYWAKSIIKLMRKTNRTFPRSFLSIDGGKVREKSYSYQEIIKSIKNYVKCEKIDGLSNLVSASFFSSKSLFDSSIVKNMIKQYLSHIRDMAPGAPFPVSIYVPETLGGEIRGRLGFPSTNSLNKVKKYVKIIGDENWIGLYIFQGVTPDHDSKWVKGMKEKYPELGNINLSAKSTTVSGTEREKDEGKQFSSLAYLNSKKNGMYVLSKAPGASIIIHNSGGRVVDGVASKSVIIEYRNKKNEYLLQQILLDNNIIPMDSNHKIYELDVNKEKDTIYIMGEKKDMFNQSGGKRDTVGKTLAKKRHRSKRKRTRRRAKVLGKSYQRTKKRRRKTLAKKHRRSKRKRTRRRKRYVAGGAQSSPTLNGVDSDFGETSNKADPPFTLNGAEFVGTSDSDFNNSFVGQADPLNEMPAERREAEACRKELATALRAVQKLEQELAEERQ